MDRPRVLVPDKYHEKAIEELSKFAEVDEKKLTPEVVSVMEQIIEFVQQATGLIHDNVEEVLEEVNLARKNISGAGGQLTSDDIEKLIQQRKDARAQKNWKRADEIRHQLGEAGIVLKDNPDGTVSWSYK